MLHIKHIHVHELSAVLREDRPEDQNSVDTTDLGWTTAPEFTAGQGTTSQDTKVNLARGGDYDGRARLPTGLPTTSFCRNGGRPSRTVEDEQPRATSDTVGSRKQQQPSSGASQRFTVTRHKRLHQLGQEGKQHHRHPKNKETTTSTASKTTAAQRTTTNTKTITERATFTTNTTTALKKQHDEQQHPQQEQQKQQDKSVRASQSNRATGEWP